MHVSVPSGQSEKDATEAANLRELAEEIFEEHPVHETLRPRTCCQNEAGYESKKLQIGESIGCWHLNCHREVRCRTLHNLNPASHLMQTTVNSQITVKSLSRQLPNHSYCHTVTPLYVRGDCVTAVDNRMIEPMHRHNESALGVTPERGRRALGPHISSLLSLKIKTAGCDGGDFLCVEFLVTNTRKIRANCDSNQSGIVKTHFDKSLS